MKDVPTITVRMISPDEAWDGTCDMCGCDLFQDRRIHVCRDGTTIAIAVQSSRLAKLGIENTVCRDCNSRIVDAKMWPHLDRFIERVVRRTLPEDVKS